MKKSKRVLRTPMEERVSKKNDKKRRQPSAVTTEGREKQLVALTISLAEKQIREGTVSSQVMTHFLKLGSSMEELAKEKLKKENLLLEAKTDTLKSAKKVEELYAKALAAMQEYSGKKPLEKKND